MIEAIELTVRRRGRNVLDAVSFDVRPGQVTGVLGGTGAGKTTLLRRMVELERGGGVTLFDGRPYRSLRHPMREIGLLLEPGAGHPHRTVRGHLDLALATDRRAARDGTREGNRPAFGHPPNRSPRRIERTPFGTPTDSLAGAWHGPPGRGSTLTGSGSGSGSGSGADTGTGGGSGSSTGGGGSTRSSSGSGGGRWIGGRGDGGRGDGGRGRGGNSGSGGRGGGSGSGYGDESGGGSGSGSRDSDGGGSGRWRRLADRLTASRGGSPAERIDAVLDIVGLTEQAETRLEDLTDGMATRLGIAVALLGDPKTLLFDAPERCLEPEGVAWLGALLRAFTGQGRAALVTGSDTETLVGLADRILLLDSGYLVGTRTSEEVLRAPTGAAVIVRSPQIVRFATVLTEAGARSAQGEGACLEVRGLDRARVGDLAYRHGIPVHELSERFTGSDPGDVVLAACSGRSRPVVPLQGFPETASEISGILANIVAAPPAESATEPAPASWPAVLRAESLSGSAIGAEPVFEPAGVGAELDEVGASPSGGEAASVEAAELSGEVGR